MSKPRTHRPLTLTHPQQTAVGHTVWIIAAMVSLAACGANDGGGQSQTGGATGSGGSALTGGSSGASGGVTGSGGRSGGSGGAATSSGGSSSSGGQPGTGGQTASGGSGTGGGAASGGGGAGSAGRSGSGGSASTGGAAGGRSGSGGSGGAPSGSGGRTGTLRIMPLGDSTTGSVCYRAELWKQLNAAGHTGKFDFVGSRKNDPGCNVSGYDQDNEGHPSVLVTDFIKDADDQVSGTQTLDSILGKYPADVVLFHFATNDVWNRIANNTILSAYATVLTALRKANPSVVVLVAQLIPMDVTASTCSGCSCSTCPSQIMQFNSALAGASGWAATQSTTQSPVVVVDQWTGFNAASGADTRDGVHPNASGSTKIATKWAQALAPYF